MRRRIVVLWLWCLPVVVFGQQRPLFTQYMFNGLAINPAYSAMDEAFTVTAAYRQQWTGFEGAPNTQTFTIHTPIKESNTSVGMMIGRDQAGQALTDQGAWLTLARRVPVGEVSWLAAGILGGVSKYSADYAALMDGVSSTDPLFNNENDLNLNLGWGAMLFSDKYFVGISSPFFFSHKLDASTDYPTPGSRHLLLYGGYLFNPEGSFKFKPSALVKYVKGSPVQADLNANLFVGDLLWIGGSWRSFDSVDLLAGIQATRNIQLGYSYDFTSTNLASAERGSHEIVLKFRVPVKGRGFPRCYF